MFQARLLSSKTYFHANFIAQNPPLRSTSAMRSTAIETTRVDQWVWAVRLYKTRSAATAACRGGHVRVNGAPAKASTKVKLGDRIEAFIERRRVVEVAAVVEKRVGAAAAAKAFVDHSPPAPVIRRQPPPSRREPGSGRPTKRDRRQIDRLKRSP
jgi:ribosome-associated heat shock protein Hsp15